MKRQPRGARPAAICQVLHQCLGHPRRLFGALHHEGAEHMGRQACVLRHCMPATEPIPQVWNNIQAR
eukprot:12923979-Prorocentrum_lima.AAC.1